MTYSISRISWDTNVKHLYPKRIEVWCADVTILKTLEVKKHYIHFLMDHYSKIILGYSIENSPSPKAIKNLLQEAYLEHKNKDVISLGQMMVLKM